MNTLTPAELETLQIMARKGSMKAVARDRGVAIDTVSGTLKSIYRKLNVHSSTEAAYLLGRSEVGAGYPASYIEKCLTEALVLLRN